MNPLKQNKSIIMRIIFIFLKENTSQNIVYAKTVNKINFVSALSVKEEKLTN